LKHSNSTININKDITTFNFGSTDYFTTQHILHGHISFSNLKIEDNGLDDYKVVLKIKISPKLSEFGIPDTFKDFEFGTKSQVISNSAIRDGELDFVYTINELDDISWHPAYDPSYKTFIYGSDLRDRYNFTIDPSIEFHRSSFRNATFVISHQISTFKTLDIPTEYFHHKLMMNSTLIPKTIKMDTGTTIAELKTGYLFLSDELIPRYFKSTEDHKLNLSKIPALIRLRLELSNNENKYLRGFSVFHEGRNGLRTEQGESYEEFKLAVDLSDTPLIPITIRAVSYTGEIRLKAQVEITSLWSDKALYAKNEYFLSPNKYLAILVFVGTLFTFKLVQYAEYRIMQNIIANKNYDLVEEEFMN
jgi:hypothetical protein